MCVCGWVGMVVVAVVLVAVVLVAVVVVVVVVVVEVVEEVVVVVVAADGGEEEEGDGRALHLRACKRVRRVLCAAVGLRCEWERGEGCCCGG